MWWVIYIVGCLINIALLGDYVKSLFNPVNPIAVFVYLIAVFGSYGTWVMIFVEWAITRK